jgi:hypothetical protein
MASIEQLNPATARPELRGDMPQRQVDGRLLR